MKNFGLAAGLLAALLGTAATAQTPPPQPQPLGRNLSGEECVLTAGSGNRHGIFCAGVASAAADVVTLDQNKDPEELLGDEGLLRGVGRGVACTGPVRPMTMPSGLRGAVRTCQGPDGFPRFALAARGQRTQLAVGHMTALDLAREVMGKQDRGSSSQPSRPPQSGRPQQSRPQQGRQQQQQQQPTPQPADSGDVKQRIAALEAEVGGSMALIGLQDIGKLDKLRELGNSYNSLRDYPRAEDAWRRALDMQERLTGSNNPAIGDTLGHLALNVANQQRFDEAERLFLRADPLTRQSPDPDHHPRLLVYRAFLQELQGKYGEALRLVAQSIQIRRERREARDALAHSLYAEASLALKSGDIPRAERAAREARMNFGAAYGSVNWWVAEAIELQADLARRANRLDEARQLNTQLIELREILFGPSRPLARAFAQAADIEQAANRPDQALQAWRRMGQTVVKDRRARGEADANDFAGYALAALRQARNDGGQAPGLTDEAFRASQVPRGGAAAQAIGQMAARLAAGTPELTALTRELQDGYQKLDSMRQDLSTEMSKPSAARVPAVEAELKRRIAETSAQVDQIDQRLAREFPAFAQLQSPAPAGAAEIAKLLKPGEALVTMLSSDQGTLVFLLRDGKLKAHAVALSQRALDTVVRELRRGLDWTKGGQADFDLELSYKLYRALLEPLEADMAGVKHLILVPAGPLLAIPPAVLVAKPSAPKRYADAEWLVRRHALSVVPSIDALRALRAATAQARSAPKPFIGFGAPSFSGVPGQQDARAELGATCRDREDTIAKLLRGLEPLPETAGELRAMAKSLGAPADSVLLGNAANEAQVRKTDLSQYRVVAFATHGLLPGDLVCDTEPALAFTPPVKPAKDNDGLLDASEIATLKLNADFVILSACNTAAPDGKLGGESLSGLTRAFFYAGARSLYAASYPVPSEQTAELTSGIFTELAKDKTLSRAEAARRSQLKLIQVRDIAHPVFWAGFVLIGD